MNWKNTILVFSPPDWPVFLTAVAAALVLFELAGLLWRIWRGRRPAAAIGMTLALLGGPVTAIAAAVFGGASARDANKDFAAAPAPGKTLAPAAMRFTFLAALAACIARWRPEGAVVAITACAAAWAVRAYARTTAGTSRPWKRFLLLLRVAAILVLGLWAMGPQLEYPTQVKVRRALLIGIDLSSSMQRRDVQAESGAPADSLPPAISRIDAVQTALNSASEEIQRIAEEADVRIFGFSSGQQTLADLGEAALPGAAPLALTQHSVFPLTLPPASGGATAIGDAAFEAANAVLNQGRELAAVVLVSDGCNNTSQALTPDTFAARMAVARVPVHTVGAGSDQVTQSTRGLSVMDLAAPDQVEAFNRLPVRATVEALGLAGRSVRVSCRFGSESNSPAAAIAAEANDDQVFAITQPKETITADFSRIPIASGFHRLTVTAACLTPPDGLAGQFSADKLVQVVDKGLRILYIEGVYRYEVKFITQALAAAGHFTIDRRILIQPLRQDQPPPLGEDINDWRKYHAIIIGDLPAAALTPAQQSIIEELVGKEGKGLCMIGGAQSFGRGGWEKTPLAKVLPVDLAESSEQIDRELRVVPTARGLADPMMSIGKDGQSPAAAWAELSVLPGANKLGGVKPGATDLADTADGLPLIVSQQYGAGRSLAVAFDTTWLWVTTKDTGELQRRFWRQVAMWLCQPKGNVWVTTDQPRYELARLTAGKDSVEITAGIEDPQGAPMPDANLDLRLTYPDGKILPIQLVTDPNDHRRLARLTGLQFTAPGTYAITLEANVDGKRLSADHRFDVQQRDLEALDVLANFKLLQRLSETSGSRFVRLSEMTALLEDIRRQGGSAPRVVQKNEHFDLADYLRWPFLAAFLTLICLEWAVRKRRGLV